MIKRSTTRGQQGDFLRVCDRSGFTVWASDTIKEWNGLIVYKKFHEPRQPQDFVRSKRDDMHVPDPRLVPTPQFTGPLITELAADLSAGAMSATVVSSVRFSATDRVSIFLNSGDAFFVQISAVPDETTIEFAFTPLPGPASSGAKVVNYSAVAS